MNRIKTLVLLFALVQSSVLCFGQTSSENEFTVLEAVQHALENNLQTKNAELDEQIAQKRVWEALATGLPQLDASASVIDNLKLMTTLLPAEMMPGGTPGEFVPVQFGTKYNSQYGIEATQLLFNGSWIVGVQTAKLYQTLTEAQSKKVDVDLAQGVVSNYYLCLVTQESIAILEKNKDNILAIYDKTKRLAQVGIAEQTDVDQLEVQVIAMNNALLSMQRNLASNQNMLRFQLGLSQTAPLNLSSNLADLSGEVLLANGLKNEFTVADNIDYQLVEFQEKMSEKQVKLDKAAFLPTLAAFYNYAKSGMGNEFSDQEFYPNSTIGVSLSLPIFSSGGRLAKVKQSQLELQKVANSKQLLLEQLMVQETQYRFDMNNAIENYKSQQKNVEVSKRVYESIALKYDQGMVSSLDLTQANNTYLGAESQFINAELGLLQAALNLDKLINNLSQLRGAN